MFVMVSDVLLCKECCWYAIPMLCVACSVEYNMSYAYHAVSSYFNRDNVALPGFVQYFRTAALDERSHAQKLMDFQVGFPTTRITPGCMT